MSTSPSYRQIQESTAALRQIPLASVIPLAFPGASGPHKGQGRDVVQWELPDQTKINVKTTSQSDLFKIWSGDRAGQSGAGAINFLVAAGVCPDFSSAKSWLVDAIPTVTPPTLHPSDPSTTDQPFRMPHFYRNAREAWPLIADYLTGERKLPASVIQAVLRQDPPAIVAGWGPKYGHYLLFPCWAHDQPLRDAHPTGAIMRWRHGTNLPPQEWYGGNPRPMAAGSHKRDGWWQIGLSDAPTVIITEAPIDALSVAASLPTVSDRHPDLPPDVALIALGGEAGFDLRQLTGHRHIVIATDNDPAGERFAAHIRAAVQTTGQAVTRVRPPDPWKDWNAVWQAEPAAARATWAHALTQLPVPEVER